MPSSRPLDPAFYVASGDCSDHQCSEASTLLTELFPQRDRAGSLTRETSEEWRGLGELSLIWQWVSPCSEGNTGGHLSLLQWECEKETNKASLTQVWYNVWVQLCLIPGARQYSFRGHGDEARAFVLAIQLLETYPMEMPLNFCNNLESIEELADHSMYSWGHWNIIRPLKNSGWEDWVWKKNVSPMKLI